MTEVTPEPGSSLGSEHDVETGAGERPTGRWGARWVLPVSLVTGYLAQVFFRLWLDRGQNFPVVLPDEPMYLVIARVLAGLPTTEIPGNEVIPGGYPLLLAPAMRLADGPVQAYHLIMVTNALISALVLPLGYWAARRLQVPRGLSYLFAFAAALLPPAVFYAQYAMADTPLPALVLAWLIGMHGLLSDGTRRRRVLFGLLTGGAAGYMMLVHDRGSVVVVLTGLVLLVVLVFGWAPRIATATGLGAIVALFFAKQVMTQWLVSHIANAHPSQVGNVLVENLENSELLDRTVMRTVGHLWYFATSTWGIGAMVALACVVVVFTRGQSKANRVCAFLMVSLMCGVALAAAAALPEDGRIDTIVYARYLSLLVPVFFLVGLVLILRLPWKRLALLGGVTVVLVGAQTLLLLHLAGGVWKKSYFILWGLPDVTFLSTLTGGSWWSFHAWRTTVVALLVLAVVLLIRVPARTGRRAVLASGAVGVLLLAFGGWATYSITENVVKPNTRSRYGDATGFLKQAGIKPGEKLVMDSGFRWETQMTLAFTVLDGKVMTRDVLSGKDQVPAEATAVVVCLWDTAKPADQSWPNHPADWHVAVAHQDKGYVLWRKG
ncbi:hypothetical protein OU787_12550 [Kitasatospora sp. YST-16]|uniref:hypothetical protein n=1 Tax=Kitasatospora sp. YST-16 TaxID=2998080 RepID=UPI002284B341|nr:hypothetical protein [Kitasatospora sp. YST-16]WAL72258.1 hypothetical protein OU787_12550 [Kitasatospora sp. YST-16]WNW38304.1 hypothetical protein RKE32_12515 [Streptomyces sp. Li-HN-5-13]